VLQAVAGGHVVAPVLRAFEKVVLRPSWSTDFPPGSEVPWGFDAACGHVHLAAHAWCLDTVGLPGVPGWVRLNPCDCASANQRFTYTQGRLVWHAPDGRGDMCLDTDVAAAVGLSVRVVPCIPGSLHQQFSGSMLPVTQEEGDTLVGSAQLEPNNHDATENEADESSSTDEPPPATPPPPPPSVFQHGKHMLLKRKVTFNRCLDAHFADGAKEGTAVVRACPEPSDADANTSTPADWTISHCSQLVHVASDTCLTVAR
jgi:hypothetical protein